jgi:MerR HTH family regulatory protein
MQPEEMIAAEVFYIHHNIELSFINSLHESGLIEITREEEKIFIPLSQVGQLEKMVRLHYEMGINPEGIETITYLLERMNEMQRQIVYLTNKLSMYEDE